MACAACIPARVHKQQQLQDLPKDMLSMSTYFLLLALPVVTLCYTVDQRQIYVDNSQTGVNDSSCWEGGYSIPCLSLDLALKGAQHYNHSTTILLQPGQHQLYSGSETQLRNMSQLAIAGNGSEGEPVVITCQPLAGLAFLWSTNITISNLRLVGCGKLQNRNNECENDRYLSQVAILFTGCSSIELSNLHVNESNGTGVAVYNAMGKVSIDSCQFSYNGLSDEGMYGGGGLVIEASEATSQSFCTITNSTFTHNTASSAGLQWINPCGSARGGGISVVLRGEATNNTVQLLNSVRLNSNKAQFGGGLFIAFFSNASGNTVTVDNAEVTENEVLIQMASSASGGGIFIGFAGTNRLFGNVVAINSSRIISNEADIGGGISVNLVHNTRECSTDSNKLLIENSTFDSNTAFQGSSAYLSQSGKCSQPLLNTTVSSSNFTNGHCGTVLRNGFVFRCSGNVLVESMPQVTFEDAVIFVGNSYFGNLSALSLRSSSIELSSSAQLQFINNSAVNGAGIHLVGSSSIILNNGSTLLFEHNTASGQGGAIYADTCTLGQTDGLDDCVVKHSNPALHPDDWGVNITFIDNFAGLTFGQDNAIYVDSVQSYDYPFNGTFCWKGWFYITSSGVEGKCIWYLRSGPVYYINYGPHNYTIYSGNSLYYVVSLRMHDAWGNYVNIYEVAHKIPIEFISGPAFAFRRPGTLSSPILVNCYSDNTNQSSLLYVHPLQFPGFAVTIHFEQCGDQYCGCGDPSPPYSPYPSHDYLNCRSGDYCYSAGGHGVCPFTYYICNYTKQSSCAQGREGILCGNCSEGYAVATNDPDLSCVECNSPYYGVAIFLLLQLVPVLIMLTLLAVLHIKITDGHLSGFVLFSQMVTLQFPGLGYTSWLPNIEHILSNFYRQHFSSIPLIVYSIWNLNFLNLDPVPFCISHIDTAAKAILLQYTTAACPLVFIVVTYTWIKCYNNGYRLVVYTTRPVHQLLARFWQKFKIQPSLIDTYAGLMLLSYMRFLATSAKLLKFTFVINGSIDDSNYHEAQNYSVAFYYDANLSYFGWPHAAYGVLAILCLLVFVVTPTIVIFFYHLKSFQRCLTRCKLDRPGLHALVDTYQGCFKNSATDGRERRYFAGIYLLFRFCYVAFIVTPFTTYRPFLIFKTCLLVITFSMMAVFRPYKRAAHNFTSFMSVVAVAVYTLFGELFIFISPYPIIIVLYIPFLVLCSYLTYCLFKPCCPRINICKIKTVRNPANVEPPPEDQALPIDVSVTTVALDDFVADDLYADRILNPDEYKEQ